MTCHGCAAAEDNPRTDVFGQGCDPCAARAIALVTPTLSGQRYRETLAKMLPGVELKRANRMVVMCAQRIHQADKAAVTRAEVRRIQGRAR